MGWQANFCGQNETLRIYDFVWRFIFKLIASALSPKAALSKCQPICTTKLSLHQLCVLQTSSVDGFRISLEEGQAVLRSDYENSLFWWHFPALRKKYTANWSQEHYFDFCTELPKTSHPKEKNSLQPQLFSLVQRGLFLWFLTVFELYRGRYF